MKSIEQEDVLFHSSETGDKEGTYEQKNGGDLGSKTVYNGNSSNSNVFVPKKVKKPKSETVVFSD
jgi:hypothetical protein